MNTYITTERNNGSDEFINASTDKDMIIKQLLILSNNLKIQILTENNELKDFMEYMEEKENNQNKCIDVSKLSLEELPADILVKRFKSLNDYIDKFEPYSDKEVIQKMRNIINGIEN